MFSKENKFGEKRANESVGVVLISHNFQKATVHYNQPRGRKRTNERTNDRRPKGERVHPSKREREGKKRKNNLRPMTK